MDGKRSPSCLTIWRLICKIFHFSIGALQTSILLLSRPLIVSFTLKVKKAQ